jgi:hypothetical protein
VLLAAVASHPLTIAQIQARPDLMKFIEKWVELNKAFLIALFGETLVSIVTHNDESHFHLHAFAVPLTNPTDNHFTVEVIWPPLAAQGALRRQGGTRKQQRQAFREAAKRIQDKYYEQVGAPSGLLRLGTRVQRLPRNARLAQNRQAQALAERHADLDTREARLNDEVTRQIAAHKAATINAATDEINAVQEEAAARFRKARAGAVELGKQLAATRSEEARLREILREHGIDPDGYSPSGR